MDDELIFLEELHHRFTTNSEITFDNKCIIIPLEIYDRWIDGFIKSRIKDLKKCLKSKEKGR